MNKLLTRAVESARKTGHSLFSPSGSWKYMLCSGSAYMERDYESTSNKYADLGTDKHELSEICLRKGTDPANYQGRIMTLGNEVDDEFIEHVQYYVDFVRRCANGSSFTAYEMRVDLSDVKQLPDEGGTADAVVIRDNWLYVVDAKFGYGKVPAEENYQLLEYAIGVYNELDTFGLADGIEKVSLVIVQPQHDLIDDWVTDVPYLQAHSAKVSAAVEEACQPFLTGKPVLTPGPKQCRWCKAFADCPAAVNVVFETVTNKVISADAFDDLTAEDVQEEIELTTKRAASYNPEKLAKCYALLDYINDWTKAVAQRVYEKLDHGEPVPHWKLVAGRKGQRQYKDPEAAEATLKAARIRQDDMYTKKLISPTQAEKLLKTSKPKVWAKLEPLVTQADGKPVIAPENDKRPSIKATVDQFDTVEDDLV